MIRYRRLTYLDISEPGVTISTSRDQWQLIYDFAYAFEFDSLWIAACQNLGTDIDPIEKIRIGRRRGWANVLSQGLEDFSRSSRRAPSPGSEDAALLGYDGLRTIMELRLQHSLSLRIPPAIIFPITDVPPIARASTSHEELATGSRVRFSPVETFFDANRSTIISDSTTRVDESPLPSSTATHHSLFIPGFLQVPKSLSEIYQDTEEHHSGRRGTSRTHRNLVPKIVEIVDSTEINALPQLPSTHEINDLAINVMIPSPSSSSITPYIGHQLVENSRITPLNKRPFIEEPKMVPSENQGSSFVAETDDAARIVEYPLSSSLPMSGLKEEIEEVMGSLLVTSSAVEIIPLVEQHIEYSGPPPPLSLPLGECVHILTPPWSAQPDLLPGVVPGPTKVKDVAPEYLAHNPADEYEAISRFSVDVGELMTQLPQSTPKTDSFQTPLESSSSNNPETVDVVPLTRLPSGNPGDASAKASPDSSFPMVLAQPITDIKQELTDTTATIPDHLSVPNSIDEGEDIPLAYIASSNIVPSENMPLPLSPSIRFSEDLIETQRSKKMSTTVPRNEAISPTVTPMGILNPAGARDLPASPPLEHPASLNNCEQSYARQNIHDEKASEGVSNEISLIDISASDVREGELKGVASESQQEDESSGMKDNQAAEGSRKDQDEHDLSMKGLTSSQRKKLKAKMKREKEKEKETTERIRRARSS